MIITELMLAWLFDGRYASGFEDCAWRNM